MYDVEEKTLQDLTKTCFTPIFIFFLRGWGSRCHSSLWKSKARYTTPGCLSRPVQFLCLFSLSLSLFLFANRVSDSLLPFDFSVFYSFLFTSFLAFSLFSTEKKKKLLVSISQVDAVFKLILWFKLFRRFWIEDLQTAQQRP